MRSRGASVLSLGLVLAVSIAASRAAALPNVNVSNQPDTFHCSASIAVDRADPQRLVALPSKGYSKAFWSEDGGSSWSAAAMPLESPSEIWWPTVAFDSRGNVYGTWEGAAIYLSRSSDGGRTWLDEPIEVHTYTPPAYWEWPRMAVNHQPGTACQDLVCLAWTATTPSESQIRVSCASDVTGEWHETVVATGALYFLPTLAFGPDGDLVVAWGNWDDSSINMVRSTDCGETFSDPSSAVSGLLILDHRFAIAGFTMRVPATPSPTAYPVLDVDRSSGPWRGTLHAVWTDMEAGSTCEFCCSREGCATDVYYAASYDGGVSWSSPILIHEDAPGSDQFLPWLAVNDTDGSVHVVWYDTRGDTTRESTNVWYRSSSDGGLSWGPELKITTARTNEAVMPPASIYDYGYYTGLAVHGCSVWPAWTDRRAGTEQTYTAPMAIAGAGAPPEDLGNTLRAVAGPEGATELSWSDLGGSELSYRVYRGESPDFATLPPELIGVSGGPDVTSYTDAGSPGAAILFYKVRATGPCGEERADW